MTVLSALRMIRAHSDEDVRAGRFDPIGLVETNEMEIQTPSGPSRIALRERGYATGELKLMLGLAGFQVENLWGGTAGNWGRRQLEMDEYELMAVSRKP